MSLAVSRLAVRPILDPNWFLEQLPAQIRAEVSWANQPIREGLAELRSHEADLARLSRVADALMEPFASLIRAAMRAFDNDPSNLELAADADLARHRHQLETVLVDEESLDTCDWVFELLERLIAITAPMLASTPKLELDIDIDKMRSSHAVVAYFRASTALMAAAEEARLGTDAELTSDLVDLAFIELTRMHELLAIEGIELEPFADDRFQRFARNVEWLRAGLTEAEHEILTNARLRDFDATSAHEHASGTRSPSISSTPR